MFLLFHVLGYRCLRDYETVSSARELDFVRGRVKRAYFSVKEKKSKGFFLSLLFVVICSLV